MVGADHPNAVVTGGAERGGYLGMNETTTEQPEPVTEIAVPFRLSVQPVSRRADVTLPSAVDRMDQTPSPPDSAERCARVVATPRAAQ